MKRSAATQEPWVQFLRQEVKGLFIGTDGKPEAGWFIGGLPSGTTYIQFRPKGQSAQIIRLPYRWLASERANIYERVKKIRTSMLAGGRTLQAASTEIEGRSSHHQEDWALLVEQFRQHKLHHGKVPIKKTTWASTYQPHFDRLQILMKGPKPPTDARALLEAICSHWQPGSRSRQIAVQNTCQLLLFAVERHGFRRGAWLPPTTTVAIVGMSRDSKRIGYPLSDSEVLRLIGGIDDPRWRFALELMAVYGLRPADLANLSLRQGQLWSLYSKASGGGHTRPRQLHPLLIHGQDGPIDWQLQARFAAGETLPPLGAPGKAGDALNTFLKRRLIWKQLRAEVAQRGDELVVYSMRHSYVKRGQLRGIPPKVLAAACGHSLESHLRSYSEWQDAEAVATHFDHLAG